MNEDVMIKKREAKERFGSGSTMHSILYVLILWCLLNSQIEMLFIR